MADFYTEAEAAAFPKMEERECKGCDFKRRVLIYGRRAGCKKGGEFWTQFCTVCELGQQIAKYRRAITKLEARQQKAWEAQQRQIAKRRLQGGK